MESSKQAQAPQQDYSEVKKTQTSTHSLCEMMRERVTLLPTTAKTENQENEVSGHMKETPKP